MTPPVVVTTHQLDDGNNENKNKNKSNNNNNNNKKSPSSSNNNRLVTKNTKSDYHRHYLHMNHNPTIAAQHQQFVRFLRESAEYFVEKQAKKGRRRPHKGLKHPHLHTDYDIVSYLTRKIGNQCPLSWQNFVRDSGKIRAFTDFVVPCLAPPLLLLKRPSTLSSFCYLTKRCIRIEYGRHECQNIDMFFPNNQHQTRQPRGLIFFVHGGFWGSGAPWMYRLIALPFLKLNLAVAIVGYRTYPCGTINAQVQDLECAANELARRYPTLCCRPKTTTTTTSKSDYIGVCVVGHSSGAHISLHMIALRTKHQIIIAEQKKNTNQHQGEPNSDNNSSSSNSMIMQIDSFIGLSGPYDIANHYEYEVVRGLEEFSPLKPVCGYSREEFRKNSPALHIQDFMTEYLEQDCHNSIDNILPSHMVLIHGIIDDVVPFSATSDTARVLRSCGYTKCEEIYLAKTGHNETVGHLMIGGETKDAVIQWITQQEQQQQQQSLVSSSSSVASGNIGRTSSKIKLIHQSKL